MKVIAIVGAVLEAEQKGCVFVRTAGTSAGAIVAALLSAGYQGRELVAILEELNTEALLDVETKLADGGLFKWFQLYIKMGFYKGDSLEKWLEEKLAAKGIRTFEDLPADTLRVIVSDVSIGRMLVLPDELHHYGLDGQKFSVAKAVRMSCSLPFYFQPVPLYNAAGKKSLIVDGGVLSNFPIWLFKSKGQKAKRPVLGFRLTGERPIYAKRKVTNGLQLFRALFATMQNAHDNRYISEHHVKDIIFLPVTKVDTTDFQLSTKEKEQLLLLGREKAKAFFRTWGY